MLPIALGKPSPWEMYRRKLKVLNQNKLIVFADDYFGIFPSHEVFMLADVPIRDMEKELNITREQIYAKYTDPLGDKKTWKIFNGFPSGKLMAALFLISEFYYEHWIFDIRDSFLNWSFAVFEAV